MKVELVERLLAGSEIYVVPDGIHLLSDWTGLLRQRVRLDRQAADPQRASELFYRDGASSRGRDEQ